MLRAYFRCLASFHVMRRILIAIVMNAPIANDVHTRHTSRSFSECEFASKEKLPPLHKNVFLLILPSLKIVSSKHVPPASKRVTRVAPHVCGASVRPWLDWQASEFPPALSYQHSLCFDLRLTLSPCSENNSQRTPVELSRISSFVYFSAYVCYPLPLHEHLPSCCYDAHQYCKGYLFSSFSRFKALPAVEGFYAHRNSHAQPVRSQTATEGRERERKRHEPDPGDGRVGVHRHLVRRK